MAFYCPACHSALFSSTPASAPRTSIFFFEALTVVFALAWAAQLKHPPCKLLIHSDSLNTIEMFHSLKAQDGYNDLLLFAVHLLLLSHISLRVTHISGSANTITDALSCMLFEVALSLHPNLAIRFFEPPWDVLGVVEL
ncbi:hypothetical protein K439DRAFT_1357494 [Ramaria rubella]|nr:hypothetical protein K439DRAFT_1357494 [Ramaria rubella]